MNQIIPKRRGRPRKSGAPPLSQSDSYFRKYSVIPYSERERMALEGITNNDLIQLQKILRIDQDCIARLLMMDLDRLRIMKSEDVFSPVVSDRIIALLELYKLGVEIMGEFELFNEWMKRPSEAFIYHRPLDIIGTHVGLLEVRQVLIEIKNGHY